MKSKIKNQKSKIKIPQSAIRNPQCEILICGFGGQGIIFAGELLGRAGMHAGMEAAQSASYGAEARGSACHAEVLLSSEHIPYPRVRRPDLLIAMSQAGYDKFAAKVKKDGRIVYDSDLVSPRKLDSVEQTPFAATAAATELGRRGVANVVMLAAVVSTTGMIPPDALKSALEEQTPEKYREVNLKALEVGQNMGMTISAPTSWGGEKDISAG